MRAKRKKRVKMRRREDKEERKRKKKRRQKNNRKKKNNMKSSKKFKNKHNPSQQLKLQLKIYSHLIQCPQRHRIRLMISRNFRIVRQAILTILVEVSIMSMVIQATMGSRIFKERLPVDNQTPYKIIKLMLILH